MPLHEDRATRASDRQIIARTFLILITPLAILSLLRCRPHVELGRTTVRASLTSGNMADGCREMFGACSYLEAHQGGALVRVGSWVAECSWSRRNWDYQPYRQPVRSSARKIRESRTFGP